MHDIDKWSIQYNFWYVLRIHLVDKLYIKNKIKMIKIRWENVENNKDRPY